MAPLWYGMPFRDRYSDLTDSRFWEEVGPYTYLGMLKDSGIATYFWSNWQDEPTAQMILAAENLNSRLLLGPGSHCAQPRGLDMTAIVKGFFDEHLRDLPPAESEPRVTWWLNGADADQNWNRNEQWPGVRAPTESWYLAEAAYGDLRLQPTRASRAQPDFQVDYDVGANEYFAFWVDSQDGRGLTFSSATLDAAREMIGYPVVHLTLASDHPEPVVFAYLEDLGPDGAPAVIAVGRLGAAYRKTGTPPYDMLGLPWPTGLEADYAPLVPGKEVELSFALTPTSHVIDAGHRLRLVVTGADPRQRNIDELRAEPAPTIALALGGTRGAHIDLPLRPH
jgi:putative CocE/NonD family hydrolase